MSRQEEAKKPVELTKIEPLLGHTYEEYMDGLFGRETEDFCKGCHAYYEKYCEGEFHPYCNESVLDQLDSVDLSQFSPEEKLKLEVQTDPIKWAVSELDWYPEWYQAQFLRCSSLFKVLRFGRRAGKTCVMAVGGLHQAILRRGKKEGESFTVLIIAPYQSQVDKLFNEIRGFISRGSNIQPVHDRRNPYHEISFPNNSVILGHTAGVRTGSKSDKIRGLDADCFVKGTLVNTSEFAVCPIEKLTLEHTILGGGQKGFHTGPIEALMRKEECPIISISTPLTTAHCTPEHPFFDGEKDVAAKDADKVIVSLAHQSLKFSRRVIMARLAGYNFGDGWIEGETNRSKETSQTKTAGFAGQSGDLEQIIEDLCILGDTRHKITTQWKENPELGIAGWVSEFVSTHAWFLLKDSCPAGRKVYQRLRVPEWVMDDRNYVKGSFLSGLFSAESTEMKYAKNNKTPRALEIRMFSASKEYMKDWLDDLQSLFSDLRIKTSDSVIIRKDTSGGKRWRGSFRVLSAKKNIDRFIKRVGFCYNVKKRIQVNTWKLYRWYERKWNELTWVNNRKVHNATGVQSEIVRKTGLKLHDVKNNRNRWHPLFSKPKKTPAEVVEHFQWKDHYVCLPVQKGIRRSVGSARVYNLQSGAQNRYMAAGTMSHNCIILDEAAYLTKDDFDAIWAIQASHPDCLIWLSSTPKGVKEKFWEICTRKDLCYKEFWRVALESPRYTKRTHNQFIKTYDRNAFDKEILALYGEPEAGVFKKGDVDRCLRQYKYEDCKRSSSRHYIMGVDWNDRKYGGHIYINEWDPVDERFRGVHKSIIKGEEYTQTATVNEIIRLNEVWKPKYIAVDQGYGNFQIEALKMVGIQRPATGLHTKVISYTMKSVVFIRDGWTGESIKTEIKPFMVQQAAACLEQGEQTLPKFEDSPDIGGLVDQMRNYKVEKVGRDGKNIYINEYDHTLTAWMLTIMVWMLKETELGLGLPSGPTALHTAKKHEDSEKTEEESRPRKVPMYGDEKSFIAARVQFRPGMTMNTVRKQLKPQQRKTF